MLSLHHEITTCLRARGADLVDFANLGSLVQDKKKALPFGISIGVALDPQTISEIHDGPTLE